MSKFIARGITKDNKFVYGYYAKINEKHYILDVDSNYDYERGWGDAFVDGLTEIIKEPDRQIGLLDINKNIIYENDELRRIEDVSCYIKNSDITKKEIMDYFKEEGYPINEVKESDIISFKYLDYGENSRWEVKYMSIKDVATLEKFPCCWLKNETFGYEGENLQSSEYWIIIGNTHNIKEK
jgi:hypothetical protein